MKSLEESVVAAMDGSNKELYSFLPYLAQDLWEIGSDPVIIIKIISKHCKDLKNLSILNLGCGKGAVSVKISQRLGCQCYGLDALPEFIFEANSKAKEFGVEKLCKFEVGDIRTKIAELPAFAVIVLGSIGPIFGDYYATLTALKKNLKPNGIIIIDDGYIKDDDDYKHPFMQKRQAIIDQIDSVNMRLVEENIINRDEIKKSDNYIFKKLKKRCLELAKKHPDKRKLFVDYLAKQTEENDVLENKIVCATMAIKNK